MKSPAFAVMGIVAFLCTSGALLTFFAQTTQKQNVETIYIVNHAGQYFSDAQIRKDIPAWEQAANKDFSPVWDTPQVSIKLVDKAPDGSVNAVFVKNGPVQGALAYHTVTKGEPQIVVYAGTGDYYGYDNSVSFTHELFELLADPTTSMTNQGYPYPYACLVGTTSCLSILPGTVWFNEVCDPVESYVWSLDGVPISDFITPNWFSDQVNGPIDYMHELQSPLLIGKGGYAQYWDGQQWNQVTNFRHAGRDANGFLRGEQVAHSQ